MSNTMINSFKQALEEKQKNLSSSELSINNDKRLIKIFSDSLKYLAISLKNSYEINIIDISFFNKKNKYSDYIYKSENNTNSNLLIDYKISLSHNIEIIYEITANDRKHYKKLKNNYEILITTFDIISQTLYNKYLEECIKQLSLKDQITGLYNRKYLELYLDKILSLSKRENKKIAFLKIGIDKFKAVIDEFDYKIGDKVLISLSNLLKNIVRKSDIVVKIDSDEFLVVLQNIGNEENAKMLAQKIIESFAEKPIIVNNETTQTLFKTICIGISLFPDNADTIEEILRTSDNALYEAKNQGRSRFFLYNDRKMHTIDLF
ncbi:GGDEF domain-containing protein [Malaciobacter molluscorum LMG 25693]|uniref:Diguanylate cyclase n=1 Tax=Malaciobacter molluscorum LMG 25693 TaxID=870501 RepID=A0A2G1DI76_9BACT|nr:GGDEF domain-containing protein [Malaciobacter molluscorum]AXX92341.1 diguanylate cyclase [Malaciobacter molluscorum LMG 25693]PHO18208.1 GGDEF domain-containing protein [Malaciobacter molluscorum LMG 25693]